MTASIPEHDPPVLENRYLQARFSEDGSLCSLRSRKTDRESIGWHCAFLKGGDGRNIRAYERLPELFTSAQKAGLPILQVFGFHEDGMDRGYPDYRPAESLGGEEKLRKALAGIAEAGGRVSLYRSGGGIAVSMANTTDSKMRARMSIRFSELGVDAGGTAEIHSLDGSMDRASRKRLEVTLRPWQSKVVVLPEDGDAGR